MVRLPHSPRLLPPPSSEPRIVQVPNETYKAAAHLVVTGRRRLFPNAKIILAHLGGTLPCMAARTAALAHYMGCSLTPEEILEDFKSFYFETALSAYGPALRAVEEFAGHGRMVCGSDFPGAFFLVVEVWRFVGWEMIINEDLCSCQH